MEQGLLKKKKKKYFILQNALAYSEPTYIAMNL